MKLRVGQNDIHLWRFVNFMVQSNDCLILFIILENYDQKQNM